MRILYHTTARENMFSILESGIQAKNAEGLVYLCEKPEDAIKFLAIRGCKNIVTFKVKIYNKDSDKLIETFDHSYRFFKCRAFGFMGDIPAKNVQAHMQYEL